MARAMVAEAASDATSPASDPKSSGNEQGSIRRENSPL
jgi:hypothetical protein